MAAQVWDTKTQTFHGGQEHRFIENFIEDFSVTTNYLGTPPKALKAAKEAMNQIHHYPAANQEPAKSKLAEFLWEQEASQHQHRLLMGNGASELIDLVVRKALLSANKQGIRRPSWKGGPWNIQYREYQRSAETNGFKILEPENPAAVDMLCIVNPCNPTGEYYSVDIMKSWIEKNIKDEGCVIVDESMQVWSSEKFRLDSLISEHEFLKQMWDERGVSVHVMHSWTKIWSCTGLRVGSVICPTDEHCEALRRIQVPWSVNGPALAFVEAVVDEKDYLKTTWTNTPRLRASLIKSLKALPIAQEWEFEGQPFLSWIWINMKDAVVASKAESLARKAGVPVRSGKPGYNCPTFIRVAVRKDKHNQVLVNAWKEL
ncbi:pyridoxal phosphate-dependent transferase [Sporodiniella umbellata]|nr:pyridoxal phosphate-dependent transferase [Sporodiniella umbellata]